MTTIWIARHGNRLDFVYPEWFNTALRRYDPPLSEDGKEAVRELATQLKGENINHIISSPFLRTIQTAHIIAESLNLGIKLEAGLSEWHNPHWMTEKPEIHPRDELQKDYPLIDWSYESLVFPRYPETEKEVMIRMKEVARQLLRKFKDNLLLIGHKISVEGVVKGLVAENVEVESSLCSLTKIVNNKDGQWNIL